MEQLFNWIKDNFIALSSIVIAPFLAWWFGRNKQSAETKKIGAESDSIYVTSSGALVKSWQEFADEMKDEYSQCAKRNETLAEQNKQLLQQNKERLEQNNVLIERIISLEKKIEHYTTSIDKLFTLSMTEIENTNPELAEKIRKQYVELSAILSR